jgi:O-acetyl-ADP-ribose deacetylase (regulator of RNase III)
MNEVVRETKLNGTTFRLVKGDITEEDVDAIVNAANSHLRHGGGVAGAIVRKGGYIIQEESNKVAPVPVGHAAITGAGKLKARYVIHAVGPMWGEGDEEKKLRLAVQNALKLAEEKNTHSISMPAISSGIFGYPKDQNAHVILDEIRRFFDGHTTSLQEVRICIIDQGTLDYFLDEFDRNFH